MLSPEELHKNMCAPGTHWNGPFVRLCMARKPKLTWEVTRKVTSHLSSQFRLPGHAQTSEKSGLTFKIFTSAQLITMSEDPWGS